MNIIVCVKRVLDPKLPADQFKLDPQGTKVVPPEGKQPVISPYDEHAVELALKLKDKHGGKVTALTLGNDTDVPVVKHAIAMGADDGYVLADPVFAGADSFAIAHILGKAIQKIGAFDLVLCGRQAADWDEGIVGALVAENLGLPLVTLAVGVEVAGAEFKVKRITLDGFQVFSVPKPALLTVTSEVGRARLPSGFRIIQATRKVVPVWKAADLGVDVARVKASADRRKLVKLFIADTRRQVELIKGETPEEAATKLADRLKEAGAI